MENTFTLRIFTPEKMFLDDTVSSLIVQGLDGELCVQAHHMPGVFAVDTGYIKIKKDGLWRQYVSTGGFVDINHNRANIFVEFCHEEADAEKARAELESLKAKDRKSVTEHKRNAVTLARIVADLNSRPGARRRKGRGGTV